MECVLNMCQSHHITTSNALI